MSGLPERNAVAPLWTTATSGERASDRSRMGIGSGDSSSGSNSSGGLAGWLPTLALAGAAFAAGVLVAQLPARYSVSRARRSAVGIIPARYKSSRFEGKPLALILGKPMIQVSRRSLLKDHPRVRRCFFNDIRSLEMEIQSSLIGWFTESA